jgi:hypothetical protein
MDWPGRLEAVREVEIETRRSADATAHRTPIWVVVDGGDVFVRSLRGTSGRWYRELAANPDGVLYVEGEPVAIRAVAADDADSIARATRALRRKYADSPYLGAMLADGILETTLRLEPR